MNPIQNINDIANLFLKQQNPYGLLVWVFEVVLIAVAVFVLSVLLVPITKKIAFKFGFVALPSPRKIHKKIMPEAGGLAIGIPIILALLYFYFKHSYLIYSNQFLQLAVGNILVIIIGLIDDKYNLSPLKKLYLQTLVAFFMFVIGYRIAHLTNPFGANITLRLIYSFPVTIFWYLLIMNAFNLIDGSDGFATCIALAVFIVLFIAGVIFGNPIVCFVSIILIAACCGFLIFNFHPASIFLGDTGALLLGLNVAAISITGIGSLKSIAVLSLAIPLAALFIPIVDTSLSVLRRIKAKKGIFKADKKHLHHKLLNLGYSQKKVAIIGFFVTIIFGLSSLGFAFSSSKEILLIASIIITLLVAVALIFLLKKLK